MPAKAYLALIRRTNTENGFPMARLAPKERRQLQDDTRRTRSVERLSAELEAVRVQQQSIDFAANELAQVSVRLQAAVDALRQSTRQFPEATTHDPLRRRQGPQVADLLNVARTAQFPPRLLLAR